MFLSKTLWKDYVLSSFAVVALKWSLFPSLSRHNRKSFYNSSSKVCCVSHSSAYFKMFIPPLFSGSQILFSENPFKTIQLFSGKKKKRHIHSWYFYQNNIRTRRKHREMKMWNKRTSRYVRHVDWHRMKKDRQDVQGRG